MFCLCLATAPCASWRSTQRQINVRTSRAQQKKQPWRSLQQWPGGTTAAAAATPSGQQPGSEEPLTPQEALLAALQESGIPLEQIQLGRQEGDDETFLDLLDAEQDEWMRTPPPPSEFMEQLMGEASSSAGGTAEEQQQQQQPPPPQREHSET